MLKQNLRKFKIAVTEIFIREGASQLTLAIPDYSICIQLKNIIYIYINFYSKPM